MITQQGALNTTALVVPGLYVQIVPPQNLIINGIPTDILGVVGTATWGPVNVAVELGNMQEYAAAFGPVMARQYDMGTDVMIAVQQGAANFRCVRVTDGTDTAAALTVSGAAFTAKYTGSLGNLLVVTFSNGSAANTRKLVVSLGSLAPEIYDNIAGTGATFWTNLVAAVNNGNGVLRGPSLLVTAATNSTTTMPTNGTYLFSSGTAGTDGVTTLTDSVIVGSDSTTPRTGMYALRGQGCGVGMLSGVNGFTSSAALLAFGLSESVYMVGSGPSGDTISNAVTVKQGAGADSYALKLMFGDWVYWQDTVNNLMRLVAPTAFAAGKLVNQTPNQSTLNKQLYNILGTQKSGLPGTGAVAVYANADLQTLFSAGIDVIGNPSPGGAYFSCLLGQNSSSNAAINGDNYTRMTNYIAATINGAMGIFVGEDITDSLFTSIRGALNGFFANLVQQGLLGFKTKTSTSGAATRKSPFSVVCDGTNNPASRTQLGYVQSDCQVRYQSINQKFIVNIEGGQTVTVVQ